MAVCSVISFIILSRLLYIEGQPIVSVLLTFFATFLLAFFFFNIPKRKYDAWMKHQFRNETMSSNFEDDLRDDLHLSEFKTILNSVSKREAKRLEFFKDADRPR